MKNHKRLLSLVMAFVLALSLGVPALAAVEDTGFSDVAADAWYAEAVMYCQEHDLMAGIGNNRFAPEDNLTRAQLATVLYRIEGTPAVTGTDAFTDTVDGAWYSDAVLWAAQKEVMCGYGGGLFGPNDPVTREQMTTIFWRYAGSPAANSASLSDADTMSSYAVPAANWAVSNGIVAPVSGTAFAPKDNATRAQVAAALMNYDRMAQPDSSAGGNILVVYFSASNNTKTVAEHIAGELNADQFEIVPAAPYTSADLNWTDPSSRVNAEHEDTSLRDIELVSSTVENWDSYDTVFIGYPIWWAIAAWPTDSFVKANDFTGKTVIPFCTSTSSGLGESGTLLAELAGTGNWLEGQRFRSSASQSEVQEWVRSLNING